MLSLIQPTPGMACSNGFFSFLSRYCWLAGKKRLTLFPASQQYLLSFLCSIDVAMAWNYNVCEELLKNTDGENDYAGAYNLSRSCCHDPARPARAGCDDPVLYN